MEKGPWGIISKETGLEIVYSGLGIPFAACLHLQGLPVDYIITSNYFQEIQKTRAPRVKHLNLH